MTNDAEPKGALHFVFLSYGYIVFQILLTPIRIRLLTAILDRATYGVLNLVIMTVSLLAVFLSFGSFEFLVRRLPGTELAYQERMIGLLYRVFGSLAILLAAIGLPLVYFWQDFDGFRLSGLELLACALALIFYMLLQFRTFYLLGQNDLLRFRISQFLSLDVWFFVLLGASLVFRPLTISVVIWVWSGWLIFTALITNRWAPFQLAARPTEVRKPLGNVLVFSLPLLPMIFGDWLLRSADRYFVIGYAGVEKMADYGLCMNISLMLFFIGNNLISIIIPKFNRITNDMPEKTALWSSPELRRLFTIMLRYTLALTLVGGAALFILNDEILWVLADEKFHHAAYILRWAAPASLFFSCHLLFSRTLIALERSGQVGVITSVCAVLNLGLNTFFITQVFADPTVGAAVATCISLAAMALWGATTIRIGRWIDWSELKVSRLAMAVICSAVCFYATKTHLDFHPLLLVGLNGVVSLGFLLGCGLFPKHEITLLFEKK